MQDHNETIEVNSELLLIAAIKHIAKDKKDADGNFFKDLEYIELKSVERKLLIRTNKSQEEKYRLRDKFFKETLKISVENISNEFKFYVSIDELSKNDLIQVTMREIKKEQILPEYEFVTNQGISENIILQVYGIPVGYVALNHSFASLARLEIYADYRKKGYGKKLLDHVMDLCLARGEGIQIDVDPPRSAEDNPLVFYTKCLNKLNIKYKNVHAFTTQFFDCQTTLLIKIEEIIEAKYPNQLKESKLTVPQFLAMKIMGLTKTDVNKIKIDVNDYWRLKKAVAGEEVKNMTPLHLELILKHYVPQLKFISTLSVPKLNILTLFKDQTLQKKETYDIFKDIQVEGMKDGHIKLLVGIFNNVAIELLSSKLINQIIEQIKEFTPLQMTLLRTLKFEERINSSTYEVIKKITNEELISTLLQSHSSKVNHFTLAEFHDEIKALETHHKGLYLS